MNGSDNPLGIYTKNSSTRTVTAISSRVIRIKSQSEVAEMLPGERVAWCGRKIVPTWLRLDGQVYALQHDTVGVTWSKQHAHAGYRNLATCGSVWLCPVCSARITEARAAELAKITTQPDYQTAMVTLTLRHSRQDSLASLMARLVGDNRAKVKGAWQRLTSGRAWQEMKAQYGVVGWIRALEALNGKDHGWHPHLHILVVMRRDADFDKALFEYDFRQRWQACLKAVGADARWQVGCNVETTDSKIADYIAKFGKEPIIMPWSVERELAKAPSKRSKRGGRSPFQLVADYMAGDQRAKRLFIEFAGVFKGRHQLEYSEGLKALFGIDELTDQELAAREDPDTVQIAEIDRAVWQQIVKLEQRGQLLDTVEASNGDPAAVDRFIAAMVGQVVRVDLAVVMGAQPGSNLPGITVKGGDQNGTQKSGLDARWASEAQTGAETPVQNKPQGT